MKNIIALLSGLIFGVGLSISQMVNPQKVINFLDLFGNWDPSLILVMLAALIVFSGGYHLFYRRQDKPLVAEKFDLPQKTNIDKPLIIGAICFGFGWGLGGLCPGPALANITIGEPKIYGFIVIMIAGIKCADLLQKKMKL